MSRTEERKNRTSNESRAETEKRNSIAIHKTDGVNAEIEDAVYTQADI